MNWNARRDLRPWARPAQAEQLFCALNGRDEPLAPRPDGKSLLARGNGRSYGDSCLNLGNAVIGTLGLDRFISFDEETGVLECEAGVLLSDVLERVLPAGWMLPVVPGTRLITVGGAIANDVHGKNHHVTGSFGEHVLAFELRRSDGQSTICTPQSDPGLFAATVGGLGLTGLVVWARLRLARSSSSFMDVHQTRFSNLQDFAAQTHDAEKTHEHVVAWLDTSGAVLGQGLLLRGRACDDRVRTMPRERTLAVPFEPPVSLVSRPFVRVFNAAYFRRVPPRGNHRRMHAYPFLFPLDAIDGWNRIYGPRGFFQYQCVIPPDASLAATADVLALVARSGVRPFLTVLKRLGERASPGMLSFTREGWTLALDFPDQGPQTLRLMDELDAVVAAAHGRLYPAKDARMSRAMFQQGYPKWREFSQWVDPAFSSSFWRRVTES